MTDCYTLVLTIDQASLQGFRESGLRVVVARHGNGTTSNIAWLAWDPSTADVVTWGETYGVFAAEPGLRQGVPLRILTAVHPAQDRTLYPFLGNGFGPGEPAAELPSLHYDVRNESPGPAAFGLLQAGSINGPEQCSPLNAVVVNDSAVTPDFAAPTAVSLWMQRAITSGSVVSVPSNASSFSFGGSVRTLHCRYDGVLKAFVASADLTTQTRPWKTPPLTLDPAAQKNQSYCAPACAEMVLSTLGFRGLDPDVVQPALFLDIFAFRSRQFQEGHPSGVQYAINHYTQAHSDGAAPRQYAVRRNRDPKPQLLTMLRAIVDSAAASAVLVLGGHHWVVVFGAEGPDDPTGTAEHHIDQLWVCDPANGFNRPLFGGTVDPPPGGEGHLELVVSVSDFLRDSFTGLKDGMQYDDGCNYVIVTESTAPAVYDASFPTPEKLRAGACNDSTIQDALRAVLTTRFGAALSSSTQGTPRLVRRARNAEPYWLVPFVRKDCYADMLRLDAYGTYLGIAFRTPYVSLHADSAAFGLAADALQLTTPWSARRTASVGGDLVWHPSEQSTTPYNPFYRFSVGNKTAFVSLGGQVVAEVLREIDTGKAVSFE